MQPRGQLWFALEKVCKDFRDFSGLSDIEALRTLVVVLTNMLTEQKAELSKLAGEGAPEAAGGETST